MFKNKIFIAAFILLFILASIVFTNSLNYKLLNKLIIPNALISNLCS